MIIDIYLSIQSNTPVSKELIKMLKIPIDFHKDVLILLRIKNYPTLFEHLDFPSRKSLCQYILNNALENETIISTSDEVEGLLTLISSVIIDSSDKPQDYEEDTEDMIDEQTLVARLIHLMTSTNLDEQFMVKLIIKLVICSKTFAHILG